MANRDIGISICGVVVGVMLGAGSVLYTQDAALGSVTDVAYRGLDQDVRAVIDPSKLKGRDVRTPRLLLDKKRAVNPDAGWPTPFQGEPEETHSAAPSSSSACDVAKANAARVGNQIPNNQDEVYGNLSKTLDQIVLDYCGSEEEEAAVEVKANYKKAAPKKVNNNCTKLFSVGSVRFSHCKGAEQAGEDYGI